MRHHLVELHPRLRIHGIGPDRQREEVGIVLLQVLDIGDPFSQEQTVGSLDIAGEVLHICSGEPREMLAQLQLLCEVENGPEQVGKLVMLQKIGIFQQTEQEAPFLLQKQFQGREVSITALHVDMVPFQIIGRLFKIVRCPVWCNPE